MLNALSSTPHPRVTGDDRVESLKRGRKKKKRRRKEEKKKKKEGGQKNDGFSSALTPVTLNWPRVAPRRKWRSGNWRRHAFSRRGEQDRFTRPSIKKKLAQKRAEQSNPRNATQLWNRSTKPFDASVRVAITRNKTETGPSFLLLLLLLPFLSLSPFFLPSTVSSFFSPLSWLSPSTRVPLPRYSPANKTVSKICVRKYALKRDEFPPVPRSKGESRDRNFNGRVSTPRSGVQGAYTRMRRDSWEKTAGYAFSMLVDRIIRAVFRLDRILSNQMERELVSSGVSENIIAGEGGSYRRILKKKRVRLIRSECSLHSL